METGGGTPTIAPVVCTFNNAALIPRTLDSLAAQLASSTDATRAPTLVVDNASTDDTVPVVRDYAARHPEFPLRLVTETRQGIAHARRRAFDETSAAFLAFVDDDCALAPDWLAVARDFVGRHPGTGALGGRVELEWEIEPPPGVRSHGGAFAAQDLGSRSRELSGDRVHLVGAGLLVSRSAVEASGWLDQRRLVGRSGTLLDAGDDSELVIRIGRAGYEIWYCPELRLAHRVSASRIAPGYVHGVYEGFGRSTPWLDLLRNGREPGVRWALYHCARSLLSLTRATTWWVGTIATGDARRRFDASVRLHRSRGYVTGSWDLLRGALGSGRRGAS